MSDVFLSYASADRIPAVGLMRVLTARGLSVFWDSQILPGDDWESELERELQASSCVVLLWSRRAEQSRWVRSEMRFGLERRLLVPVLVDSADVPLRLREVQSVRLKLPDMNGPADELGKLMSAIQSRVRATHPERRLQRRTPETRSQDIDFGTLGL